MEKQVFVAADGAPAVGPYSPAVGVGDFVFVSGQIALDPDGRIHGYTPKDQTQKALENLKVTLAAAGLTLEHVVKTTIFLTDMAAFAEVNAAYAEALGDHRPARATVQVAALPKGALVEIEGMAAAAG